MSHTALRSQKRAGSKQTATPMHISADHCVGIVSLVDGQTILVKSGDAEFRAKRAVSCLLEIAIGDTVSCLLVAPDEVWIQAILLREEGVEPTVNFDSQTSISVSNGTLAFRADSMAMSGKQLEVKVKACRISSEDTEFVARELRFISASLSMVGTTLRSVFERVSHYSKQYFRTTEGIDRVSAEHAEIEAKQILRATGEHVLIEGKKLVKGRGGQIHFG